MNKQIRNEVESVLGRALIGHEKAIVIHSIANGMMNPLDIARAMLERHLAHNETRLNGIMDERVALQMQLANLKGVES